MTGFGLALWSKPLRSRQGFFDRPPAPETERQDIGVPSETPRPLGNRQLLTLIVEIVTAARVRLLFNRRRPSTISRFVGFVIVNAIQRMTRRTWTEVCVEILETRSPSGADLDTPAAVPAIPFDVGSRAASDSAAPRFVFAAVAHAVRRRVRFDQGIAAAAATGTPAVRDVAPIDNFCAAAVALTPPVAFSWGGGLHDQCGVPVARLKRHRLSFYMESDEV